MSGTNALFTSTDYAPAKSNNVRGRQLYSWPAGHVERYNNTEPNHKKKTDIRKRKTIKRPLATDAHRNWSSFFVMSIFLPRHTGTVICIAGSGQQTSTRLSNRKKQALLKTVPLGAQIVTREAKECTLPKKNVVYQVTFCCIGVRSHALFWRQPYRGPI